MTQSPYLPANGDQDPQPGEWESTGSPTSAEQTAFDPAAPYGQFDEPVTDPLVGSTATEELYAPVETGTPSAVDSAKETAQQTAGTAKSEAADLKDTAVDRGQQVAGVAKDQAAAVKDTAVDNAQQVAGVAKEQAAAVTAEASTQAKDLLSQGRTELSSQLGTQQQRLSTLVHSFAEELGSMGSSAEKPGPLSDLAQQGSRTVGELAHRLENSEPSDLLEDLRNFARRRPVVFLTGAALAGVVVGRLSRSLAAEAHDNKVAAETPALPSSTSGYDSGSYSAGGYETGTYATDAPTYPTAAPTYAEPPVVGYEPTVAYDDTVTYTEPGRGDITR